MPLPKQTSRSARAGAFMRKAIQYFEAGDLPKAQKNVAKYLSMDPANADANHLAGLIAFQTGKPESAVKSITRALQANPRIAMAHNNLGEAQRALENLEDAEASYRKAIALEPAQGGFRNNLGTVLLAQGRAGDAIVVYRDALGQNPRDAMIHTNLGNALMEVGDQDGAIEAHNRALSIQPTYVEARTNLGLAQLTGGDLDGARKNFETVLARYPKHVMALRPLAKIMESCGQADEAEAVHERIISIDPDDRDSYIDLSDLLRYGGRAEDAVTVFERYLQRFPSDMEARVNIASIWRVAGQRERAQAFLREALEIEPQNVAARFVLAQMTKHKAGDENIQGLTRLRSKTGLPAQKLASVNFGLGKALEDISDYDGAIACYLDANRFARQGLQYSHEDARAEFTRLKELFSPAILSAAGENGCGDATPIFIVGMPRSGTSLVEQILSSHSQVFGAGELMILNQTIGRAHANAGYRYPDDLAETEATLPGDIGRMYVDLVRTRFGDDPRITDKLPHNFMNVGMIRLALPNARVIHCQRHPMDTCFSIFKHSFAEGHNYAYNMEELGAYYRQYHALMAHWRTTLPDFMYEISYEALVDDTEPEAHRLLEFCGLDWEPACLEFYKTKRVVNTVSASQVRQPIYKDSVALWKRYEAHLQPLVEALGDVLDT